MGHFQKEPCISSFVQNATVFQNYGNEKIILCPHAVTTYLLPFGGKFVGILLPVRVKLPTI